ncbi:MAG: ribosome maturation factor RimP [Bowdeniella nasicola]|nr:ribosome maturation factor RimP [Bowdeniella nasicola]
MTSAEQQIHTLITPVAEEAGLIVEEVTIAGNNVVKIILDLPDGPGGIDSDHLAEISRTISQLMDKHDPLDSAYTLEVSTPGLSRQLREPRHFRRAGGHDVKVKLREGADVIGTVIDADDAAVRLQVGNEERTITYDQIRRAKVHLAF